MEKQLGKHLICEAVQCDRELLNSVDFLVKLLTESCIAGGAGVVSVQSKQFSPQGATVLVLLSESHCSIHTWPEYRYAMIDVATCGDVVRPDTILHLIAQELKGIAHIKQIDRGIPDTLVCDLIHENICRFKGEGDIYSRCKITYNLCPGYFPEKCTLIVPQKILVEGPNDNSDRAYQRSFNFK